MLAQSHELQPRTFEHPMFDALENSSATTGRAREGNLEHYFPREHSPQSRSQLVRASLAHNNDAQGVSRDCCSEGVERLCCLRERRVAWVGFDRENNDRETSAICSLYHRDSGGSRPIPEGVDESAGVAAHEYRGIRDRATTPIKHDVLYAVSAATTLCVSAIVAMFVRAKPIAAFCHSELRLDVASDTIVTAKP